MMFMTWSLMFISVSLLNLGSSDPDANKIHEYHACVTGSIRSGGPGEVAYITSSDDDKQDDCKLQITTCVQCKLELTVVELEMPSCNKQLPPLEQGCSSKCGAFISIHEPAYFRSTTSYISNSTSLDFTYTTRTRSLYLQFCLSSAARFKLKYIVKEKTEVFAESLPGYFTSPNFPSGYRPSSDCYKYIINNTAGGYIRLQFTDWNLANESKITIYHNHENSSYRLTRYGFDSRPFVKSQGSVLVIVFETGSESNRLRYLGFRAEYNFTVTREWPNKPYNYNCGEYFVLTWGGHFSFRTDSCPHGEIIDCVWVLYRYPLAAYSDYIWLSIYDLRLENNDRLEIRSGNNSQGTILKTNFHITSTPSDFTELDAIYVHLRATCTMDRLFKAAFVSYDNAQKQDEKYYCSNPLHFACRNQRCIYKLLKCDGINHCDDWSDEHNCNNPGTFCNSCQDGQGWFCTDVRCDGRNDCLDGSDEKDCLSGSTSLRPPVIESNHYYWGTITPVVLISLILGIITCIVISYYIRRKRLLRERTRCLNRTQTHGAGRGNNVLVESLGLSPGIYGIAPPTYEEALIAQYIPSQGTVNTAFEGTLDFPAQPPPYSPKCDVQLPIQYLPPYVATQSPALTVTEPGGSQSDPRISSHREDEPSRVTSEQGNLASEGDRSQADCGTLPSSDTSRVAVPNVSQNSVDLARQQDNTDTASSLVSEAQGTEIEMIQAVLAGRGALTGIPDVTPAISDATSAHSNMPPTNDGPGNTTTSSIHEPPPLSISRPADDHLVYNSSLESQGADNAAFESGSDGITDTSPKQSSDYEQDSICRFGVSGTAASVGDIDADISEINSSVTDHRAGVGQHQFQHLEEFQPESTVTIEETGDVFV